MRLFFSDSHVYLKCPKDPDKAKLAASQEERFLGILNKGPKRTTPAEAAPRVAKLMSREEAKVELRRRITVAEHKYLDTLVRWAHRDRMLAQFEVVQSLATARLPDGRYLHDTEFFPEAGADEPAVSATSVQPELPVVDEEASESMARGSMFPSGPQRSSSVNFELPKPPQETVRVEDDRQSSASVAQRVPIDDWQSTGSESTRRPRTPRSSSVTSNSQAAGRHNRGAARQPKTTLKQRFANALFFTPDSKRAKTLSRSSTLGSEISSPRGGGTSRVGIAPWEIIPRMERLEKCAVELVTVKEPKADDLSLQGIPEEVSAGMRDDVRAVVAEIHRSIGDAKEGGYLMVRKLREKERKAGPGPIHEKDLRADGLKYLGTRVLAQETDSDGKGIKEKDGKERLGGLLVQFNKGLKQKCLERLVKHFDGELPADVLREPVFMLANTYSPEITMEVALAALRKAAEHKKNSTPQPPDLPATPPTPIQPAEVKRP